MMKRWIGLLACLAMGQVQAASFDCGKAGTKVEKLICVDQELSKLDEELAVSYADALKSTDPASLKAEQKAWIKVRNRCVDVACIQKAYRQRTEAIRQALPRPTPAAPPDPPIQKPGLGAQPQANRGLWRCEKIVDKASRTQCEKSRDAEPYAFEIRSVGEGRGYTLCELFRQNIKALGELPHCGIKIHPKFQKYFSLPEWEDLDPWANEDYMWQVRQAQDAKCAAFVAEHGKVVPCREYEPVTREEWRRKFQQEIEEYGLKGDMKRARFDLSGDGKPEWVLAYRFIPDGPCNPWGYPLLGYKLLVLKEDGKTLDFTRAPATSGATSNEIPFFFSLNDPRFRSDRSKPSSPSNHTYRLYAGGVPVGFERGGFEVHGNYDTQGDGVIQLHFACQYDIVKKSSKPVAKGVSIEIAPRPTPISAE